MKKHLLSTAIVIFITLLTITPLSLIPTLMLTPNAINVDVLDNRIYNYVLIATDGLGEGIEDYILITIRERGLNASELQTLLEIGMGFIFASGVVGLTMIVILWRRRRK